MKDGTVRYQAVVRVDTARPVKKTFPTMEEAEAWRAEKDAELRALKETPAHEYTLGEALEDYAVYHPGPQTEEVRTSCAGLLSVALSEIDKDSLPSLSEPELMALCDVIEHARRYLGVLIAENPVKALCASREGLPYRPVTPYEEENLIALSEGLANGVLQDVIILAFDTALTQQEILDLTSEQVDLKAGIIKLSDTRIISLTPRACSVLKRRCKEYSGPLFPNTPKNTVQTAFIRLRTKLGLNGPDFNDLRKIAIRRMADKLDLSALKDALGYVRYDSLQWLLDLDVWKARSADTPAQQGS
jgi:integrase